MKKLSSTAVIVTVAVAFCTATSFAQVTRYVVTNDDNYINSATFFTIGAGGALTQTAVVPTGGAGCWPVVCCDSTVKVSRGRIARFPNFHPAPGMTPYL